MRLELSADVCSLHFGARAGESAQVDRECCDDKAKHVPSHNVMKQGCDFWQEDSTPWRLMCKYNA